MTRDNSQALAHLHWPNLLEAIAERCVGKATKRRALALPLLATLAEAVRTREEIQEAVAVLEQGETLPLHGLVDVEEPLEQLRIGVTLAAADLVNLGIMMRGAQVLTRFFRTHRTQLPRLSEACAVDSTLLEVQDELAQAFESDGTLSDHASPRLRELRTEYRTARTRLVNRLEDLMQRYAALLQDGFWTEREGRYVLPVRVDAHERFPGIVHATSGSGSTLFVEPRAIVPLGNRLKVLESEVRREEHAILKQLSEKLTLRWASVYGAFLALIHADLRGACARLAVDLELEFPEVSTEPLLDLRQARHPLLLLEGKNVVASDFRIEAGHALVISGPNAGGKTVTLKTAGLCALMQRAGLPISCSSRSRVGWFDELLTDIGDDQNMERNLSTFSAHMANMASILSQSKKGVLVLLDEVATGTDPREGEALAVALLEHLALAGAATFCTTHYEGLKLRAVEDSTLHNASVGFDRVSLRPTFQLHIGVPGGSSALFVAERFGVPSDVVERARGFLSTQESTFQRAVQQLEDQRLYLEQATLGAQRAQHEAAERMQALELERNHLRETTFDAVQREVNELREAVRRARHEVREVQATLRSAPLNPAGVREASQLLNKIASRVQPGGELDLDRQHDQAAGTPVALEGVRKGEKYWLPRLRTEIEILETLASGQLRVSAGHLKLTVTAAELQTAPKQESRGDGVQKKTKKSVPSPATFSTATPMATADTTCDLRGLGTDDALRMAEQFLDRLVSRGESTGYLRHGEGTGALRTAVRRMLRDQPYVKTFRSGTTIEGGDGMTVVLLK